MLSKFSTYPLSFKNFICLLLVALRLHCREQAFSSWSKRGLLVIVAVGILTAVASLVLQYRLLACGQVVECT